MRRYEGAVTRSPDAPRDVVVSVDEVTRTFGETRAVDRVSVDVRRGELLVLLGPSGCGKTTTLRMIAGFEVPDSGRILIEGRDVTRVPPQGRSTGMVFQNYALFPHLDVFENVAFGLKARGAPKEQIAERVARSLALVDLAGYEKRRVQQLSGGQQQRVALARAIAPEPPVLLLDEPLSNLDASLRERTRTELRALLQRLGMTAIFVTHDQDEAFALADRVAVMRAGRIEQIGAPQVLYRDPATEFVASFLGHTNLLDASILRVDERDASVLCALDAWGGRFWATPRAGATPRVGDRVRVMIRPEDIELLPPPEMGIGTLTRLELGAADITQIAAPTEMPAVGRVVGKHFAGAAVHYTLDLAHPVATDAWAETPAEAAPILASAREIGFEVGDVVTVAPRMDASVRWFPVSATPSV